MNPKIEFIVTICDYKLGYYSDDKQIYKYVEILVIKLIKKFFILKKMDRDS